MVADPGSGTITVVDQLLRPPEATMSAGFAQTVRSKCSTKEMAASSLNGSICIMITAHVFRGGSKAL
jgi:hypothetical protein